MPTNEQHVNEFVGMIDLLIGRIEDSLPGKELENIGTYVWRIAELSGSLGYPDPPMYFTCQCNPETRVHLDILEIHEPLGNGLTIRLLRTYLSLPVGTPRPPIETTRQLGLGERPFTSEDRRNLIATLKAWKRLVQMKLESVRDHPAEADDVEISGETSTASSPMSPRRGSKMPSEIALAAWRLHFATGSNQTDIADVLSRQFGRAISQGQVSRSIAQVQRYIDDGNVLPNLPKSISNISTVDPDKLDMGQRLDHRTARQRPAQSDE